MTFNPNIPATGTKINKTFQLIQENFNQLNQLYGSSTGKDHVEWNSATSADRGLHKKVQMVQTSGDPTLSHPQSQFYSKDKALPSNTGTAAFFAFNESTTANQFIRQLTDLPFTLDNIVVAGTAVERYTITTPWNMPIVCGRIQPFPSFRTIPYGFTYETLFVGLATVNDNQANNTVTVLATTTGMQLQTVNPVEVNFFAFGTLGVTP